ncbi:BPL-N domain-containing protein [Pedobacter nutrimenti]|uniref:Glutamine amidotransferase-like uncharacterized protein n=1 Tax=Pedobacter nutrimenti TaxID=1241337 RepID=A0A318UAK7_9SPHI|nr:BPL-N domain-containing protein [Pedobacter nutrimenti]PYF69969.1 glutamine amidotransferase-like uncharacterized protein [Pedobacter nutrimenti]
MHRIKLLLSLLVAITLASCSKSHSETPVPFESKDLKKGDTLRVAVYRGAASCDRCSRTVKSAIEKMGVKFRIDFVGPNEQIDITTKTLSRYDIYVQPGGGQDIPGAFKSLGNKRVEAIRKYVLSGGYYLGLCMGAYLAGESYLGLIDGDLDGEVGRPGFPVTTDKDASVVVYWKGHKENIFFQDGPYLFSKSNDPKFSKIATYENGDLAAARYSYGSGLVILTGPHAEADSNWFEDAEIPSGRRPARELFKDLIYSFYQ